MHIRTAEPTKMKTSNSKLDVAKTLTYNEYWSSFNFRDIDLIESRFPGYSELTPIQMDIFHEFVNQKKIIGSWSVACDIIRSSFKKTISDEDIIWAYAIGAGGGMEYEFPYE